MAKKKPGAWSVDAADGATMRDYEIRTITDFLDVPEPRRCVCLREFHAWLSMQTSLPALFVACGAAADSIRMMRPDVFIWKDDGKATISVVIEEGVPCP